MKIRRSEEHRCTNVSWNIQLYLQIWCDTACFYMLHRYLEGCLYINRKITAERLSLAPFWCVRVYVRVCVFFLLAIMNEISCYRKGICSFVSNYSFCSSLHRLRIDLQEEGGRYTWGQGHLIATWEKNDVGPSEEICNRAIRWAKGRETKTLASLCSLTPLITFFILKVD